MFIIYYHGEVGALGVWGELEELKLAMQAHPSVDSAPTVGLVILDEAITIHRNMQRCDAISHRETLCNVIHHITLPETCDVL